LRVSGCSVIICAGVINMNIQSLSLVILCALLVLGTVTLVSVTLGQVIVLRCETNGTHREGYIL